MKLDNIEELQVFVQVVESGSLARAARALGMPAVTAGRRLAALEARIGAPLLHRTTRNQSLSDAGRVLLERAEAVLAAVADAEAVLSADGEVLEGTVRIAVPSVLSSDLVWALQPLATRHPGLRVALRVRDQLVNPVAEGMDVVIVGGRLPDSSLVARRIGTVSTVVAASADYLERHGEPRTLADLANHHVVQFETDPPQTHWTLVGPDGTETVVPVQPRFEATDGRSVMDGIRAGLGLGRTSPRIMARDASMRRVLPDYAFVPFPIFAVHPPSGSRNPRVQAVVDTLQDVL